MALSPERQLIAAAVLAVGLIVPAAALAAGSRTTAPVNLSVGPGKKYQALIAVPVGAPVHVENCGDGWCRVFWRGRSGWVAAGFLRDEAKPSPVTAASGHILYQIMDFR